MDKKSGTISFEEGGACHKRETHIQDALLRFEVSSPETIERALKVCGLDG